MYYAISNNSEEENQVLLFSQKEKFLINEFISVEEVGKIGQDDVIIVNDMTAFGGNFIKCLSVCVSIAEKGANIFFVKDENLSVSDKERLDVFKSILNLEKKFISIRTKKGQQAARKSGVKMGRPKGSGNKIKTLDKYKANIEGYLEKDISLTSIMKIINPSLENPLSYFTYRRYVEELCK